MVLSTVVLVIFLFSGNGATSSPTSPAPVVSTLIGCPPILCRLVLGFNVRGFTSPVPVSIFIRSVYNDLVFASIEPFAGPQVTSLPVSGGLPVPSLVFPKVPLVGSWGM